MLLNTFGHGQHYRRNANHDADTKPVDAHGF